jgi:hypothetical protein
MQHFVGGTNFHEVSVQPDQARTHGTARDRVHLIPPRGLRVVAKEERGLRASGYGVGAAAAVAAVEVVLRLLGEVGQVVGDLRPVLPTRPPRPVSA